MRELSSITLILLSVLSALGQEVLRPRGVPLTKGPLYAAGQTFRCLDGSGSIPYTYVNDDYCDCRDGSDEPGTSACPNGTFHCVNNGHISVDLRSSRVNDGVCDCCDGSDEWASASPCADVCLDLGKAAREEALRREEETKRGYNLKLGMIEQGKNIRQEKENKIAQLQNELSVADGEKAEMDAAKKAAEEPEALALEKYREAEDAKKEAERRRKEEANQNEAKEAFDGLDTNGDGEVSTEEVQADSTYDTNRDGTVSEDEVGFYLQQSASVDFEKFYETSWRLMRPPYNFAKKQREGGKQVASEPLFRPPEPTMIPEEQEQLAPPTTDSPDMDAEEYDPETDDLDEGAEEDYPDEEGREEEEEGREEQEEGKEEEEEIVYDEETQALVDAANAARSAYQEAERRVKDLNKELLDEEDSLNKDFGTEDEFRVLENSCYEYTDREYKYKLCLFDKATQAPKNGGGETRLGTWGEWVTEEGGVNTYTAMKYTNGQGCWNGPNRSTKVNLVCGVENQLQGATEPSKCEYEFVFATPAACYKENTQDAMGHDEL